VTPVAEVPITPGQNIVFCATFQLAWKDMMNDVVGEPIRLEKSLELVRRLNEAAATREDIAESDYLAVAGTDSRNSLDEINRALRRKFGANVAEVTGGCGECVFVYAFLNKALRFERPFEVYNDPSGLYFQDGRAHVQAFGIYDYNEENHAAMADQVEVLAYEGPLDFVVRLRTTNPDDEIIIAKVKPAETLAATVERVEERVENAEPMELARQDVLIVPKLGVSFAHSYDELDGLYLRNDGWEEFYVAEALQDVQFLLDEEGVSVESYMKLAFKQKGPATAHRRMVCSTPFLMYMKQKDGEHPYFTVWVDNRELMIPSD